MTTLADTSVWVEALRRGGTPLTVMTARDESIGYTQPVLMELLSGCRNDDQAWNVRRLVLRGSLIAFDVAADFEGASDVFRTSRRLGITPNSYIDCMVVAVAARRRARLLTYDRQQARVAENFGVRVVG